MIKSIHFLTFIPRCLYSHLFSSHRQHAAALLHSDWLVLGPRAERSRTQAAEQVESQDRRSQRSLQGQTGVRPGHNRPPLELTPPANRLTPTVSTPQSSDGGKWASSCRKKVKEHLYAPQRLQILSRLICCFFISQRWKKEKSKFLFHFSKNLFLRKLVCLHVVSY